MTTGLVLTADDLGFEPGTNSVIPELLLEGAISATTILTISPYAEDGLAGLEKVPDAALGVHFAITSDRVRSLRPLADGVSSLVDDAGAFPVDPVEAERGARSEHVAAEIEAQIAWVTSRGWKPKRIDSHSGTLYGMHGNPFLSEAFASCVRHGLGFRMPRGLELYLGGVIPQMLGPMLRGAVKVADQFGVSLPAQMGTNRERSVASYGELRRSYLDLLDRLPENAVSEIFLHPAPDTPSIRAIDWYWQKRVWELELLRDPVWRRELDRHGVELVPTW